MSTNSNPNLLLLGVNHTTAPVEVRERLAIPSDRLADATRTLAHQPGIREALILSTCNRVELLTVLESNGAHATSAPDGSATPGTEMLRFLQDYLDVRDTDIQPHVYEFRERAAIRHLFRVASSLDSMVIGEPQILGQVKQSWSVAREVGAIKSTEATGSAEEDVRGRHAHDVAGGVLRLGVDEDAEPAFALQRVNQHAGLHAMRVGSPSTTPPWTPPCSSVPSTT